MAEFITHEVQKPGKQWVRAVLEGTQEQAEVVVRTAEFVLLPDTERVNRYRRFQQASARKGSQTWRPTVNWLSIVQDTSVRTLRDLNGSHVPMLKRMRELCMTSIEKMVGVPQDQVLAYIHYPPSVYQLHVHFSFPYGQYYHRDAFRVHNLGTVINNLELDPDYYTKITLFLAIPRWAAPGHHTALDPPSGPSDNAKSWEEAGEGIKEAVPTAEKESHSRSKRRWQNQSWSPSRVWSTVAV